MVHLRRRRQSVLDPGRGHHRRQNHYGQRGFFTRGTNWGSGFDPDDVERVPWGSITLDIDGCDSATLSYNSVAKGEFGSGTLDMQRITSLAGLNCG